MTEPTYAALDATSPAAPRTDWAQRLQQGLSTHDPMPAPAGATGLPVEQEPKYTVNGAHVINRHTGEAVPHDEPIFVFRARDALGVRALEAYLGLISERDPSSAHANAVRRRIADFQRFAESHPARMKWPDTTAPAATPGAVRVCPECDIAGCRHLRAQAPAAQRGGA
jgi:hypothetical protein